MEETTAMLWAAAASGVVAALAAIGGSVATQLLQERAESQRRRSDLALQRYQEKRDAYADLLMAWDEMYGSARGALQHHISVEKTGSNAGEQLQKAQARAELISTSQGWTEMESHVHLMHNFANAAYFLSKGDQQNYDDCVRLIKERGAATAEGQEKARQELVAAMRSELARTTAPEP